METKERMIAFVTALVLVMAVLAHYAFGPWGFYRAVPEEEAALRMHLVQTAEGWLGCQEADGSHEAIIDLYNSHEPLALGYTVQYTDSWCAAFVSAAAISCGLTDILPTECGCQRHIALFEALGRWQEDESIPPQPGDLIFYDWEETKPGDALGWSDHVGIVVGVKWPFVKVIEGNYGDQVAHRVLPLWDVRIRGYGKPDYAMRYRAGQATDVS